MWCTLMVFSAIPSVSHWERGKNTSARTQWCSYDPISTDSTAVEASLLRENEL